MSFLCLREEDTTGYPRGERERFHLTSWQPCWCTLNKIILIISFVSGTNMAAMSTLFCVSWDCVKTLYCSEQRSLVDSSIPDF